MEWQVSNKELSQRLKELGVPQESLFYYCGEFKKLERCPDRDWETSV